MSNPEFLTPFTSGLIFLSVSLILTFALNSFFSYKLGKIQQQILKYDQEATEVNRILTQAINKMRAEFGFNRVTDPIPTIPMILREKWLNHQRNVLPKNEVPFMKWVNDELAKRLEREDSLISFFESNRNVAQPIYSESDKALHGHYQEYLAICQSEKKPMMSFTHWKAQIGKEAPHA